MVEPGKLSEKSDRKIQTQTEYANRPTGTKADKQSEKETETHL